MQLNPLTADQIRFADNDGDEAWFDVFADPEEEIDHVVVTLKGEPLNAVIEGEPVFLAVHLKRDDVVALVNFFGI